MKKSIIRSFRLVSLAMILVTTPLHAATEEEIGEETDKEIVAHFGMFEDERYADYVEKVARRVLAQVGDTEYQFHFKLLNDPMVNAFALPGGYVYVTRGLLANLNSEAALAAVIGHEIGHVTGHHAMKQMQRSINSLLLTLGAMAASSEVRQNAASWLTVTSSLSAQILSGYGREAEMESDQIGMINAHEAGYDPRAMSSFLQSLKRIEKLGGRGYHGFMASHPDTVRRIIVAEGKADLLAGRDNTTRRYHDRYLDAIDGLPYGKPVWKGKTRPPWVIRIHTVSQDETFRTIAETTMGDTGKAIELAALNNHDIDDPLTPGIRIKILAPVEKTFIANPHKKEKTDEISAGTGNGKDQHDGGQHP